MAVVGGQVTASEYNGFVSRVNAILGIGSGQTGYGYAISSSHVAGSGTVNITAAQWDQLAADINVASTHQTNAAGAMGDIQVGNIIGADASNTGSGSTVTRSATDTFSIDNPANNKGVNDFQDAITVIEGNAAAVDATKIANENKLLYTTSGLTYTSTWGSGGNTGIYCEVDVTFPGGYNCKTDAGANVAASTADNRRHFFNSGGKVRIFCQIANGNGSAKDNDWITLVSNAGTIIMDRTATTTTGSGTTTNIGFYDLTTSYQRIFTKNGSQAQYAENFLYVDAAIVGNNIVRFRVGFQDADTGDQTGSGPPQDEAVGGDARVNFAQTRATGGSINMLTPTYSVVRNLGP